MMHDRGDYISNSEKKMMTVNLRIHVIKESNSHGVMLQWKKLMTS